MSSSAQATRVGLIMGVSDLMWALNTPSDPSPDYVRAVFQSYVEIKFARGKSKYDVHMKLIPLERQYIKYAKEIHQVRKQFGMPDSPVYRIEGAAARDSSSTSANSARGIGGLGNALRATTSDPNYSHQRGLGALRAARTAAERATTTRDPTLARTVGGQGTHRAASFSQPSSARHLSHSQVQQRAHSVRNRPAAANRVQASTGSDDEDLPPPPYARADPEPEQTRILQEHLAAEAESAARRRSSESVPVHGNSSTQSLGSPVIVHPTSIAEERSEPDRIPSDVELRRVWEESQLDEATRASAAAEREQRDFEEAIRLSLADAEASGSSSYANYASSSTNTNPPYEANVASEEWERDVKTHFQPSPNATLPASLSPVIQPNARVPTPQQAVDLLGDDDGMSVGATLAPSAVDHRPLQSNNPFLSGEEYPAETPAPPTPQVAAQPLSTTTSSPQTPNLNTQSYQTHLSPPNSATRQTSQTSLRDSPGSGHTYAPPVSPIRKPLPPAPGPGGIVGSPTQEIFAPPPGAPPSQTVYAAPTGAPPLPSVPALPPRRETVQSSQTYSPINGSFAPTATRQSTVSGISLVKPGGEDPLEMLKDYDTVFLIDDSLSMAGERWEHAKAALIDVSEIAARYDDDGIDVYFLNSKRVGKELKAEVDVEDLFAGLQPRGLTPIGARMEVILREYMSRLERSSVSADTSSHEHVKPMNLIVITDGAPSDDPESVIIAIAKRLDRGDYPLSQIGIQFFQIGNDPEAREALQELDDGLAGTHGVRDMVDTIPFGGEMSADLIIKTLLGGINRRLDRRTSI